MTHNEIEDGMGFAGHAPSREERRERRIGMSDKKIIASMLIELGFTRQFQPIGILETSTIDAAYKAVGWREAGTNGLDTDSIDATQH